MKTANRFQNLIVALACVGMLSAQFAQAAERIGDVALLPGGRLQGQVMNGQGIAHPNTRVAISQKGEIVTIAETDNEGRFAVHGLSAGVYEVSTAATGGVYRMWAPRTAPPTAQTAMLVVEEQDVARGQLGNHLGWLANPWMLGAIVAAAIAIPLAVNNGS